MISIIVPVYKTEKYIHQCVKSILSQTYTNFELILVDDGSPDNCGTICDEYASNDSRIVVIHKENGGVSSARNAGLDIAKGKYITFVDSDDWLHQDFLLEGINACNTYDLDIYCSGFTRVYPDKRQQDSIITKPILSYTDALSQEEMVILLQRSYIATSTCKLIRRDLLLHHRFDINLIWGEDLLFIFELLEQHLKIYAVPRIDYFYRSGHENATSSVSLKKCQNINQVYTKLYSLIEERNWGLGTYSEFIDWRCKDDLLFTESLVMKSKASVMKKYRMFTTLTKLNALHYYMQDKLLIRHLKIYSKCTILLFFKNYITEKKSRYSNSFFRQLYRRIRFEFKKMNKVNISRETAETYINQYHFQSRPNFSTTNIVNEEYDLMIIVPIYNAEQHLKNCLDSIFAQKTKYSYNVVAINDGSTDRSNEILNKYVSYKNMTVIHQENAGPSSARNHALKKINAKYVMFVDADDAIPEYAVEALLNPALMNQADMVAGGYIQFEGDKVLETVQYGTEISQRTRADIPGYVCMKVIRAKLLEHFLFPVDFWFEDTVIPYLLLPTCQKIYTIPDIIYYYRHHSKSSSATQHSQQKCVDTYWISKFCLEEAAERGYITSSLDYTQYLQQCWVNYIRTRYLPDNIQKSIFVLTKALFSKYFSNQQPVNGLKYKMLHQAFKNNSYEAYLFVLRRWEVIND